LLVVVNCEFQFLRTDFIPKKGNFHFKKYFKKIFKKIFFFAKSKNQKILKLKKIFWNSKKNFLFF